MSFLTIQVDGLDGTVKHITEMLGRAQDLRPFWTDVFAPKYFGLVQDAFATGGRARGAGGRFRGGAWPPLNPVYRKWKTAHFPGQPMLVRTGRLRDSVDWNGTGLGPDGVWQPDTRSLVLGTKVPYGTFHMTGTLRMPARPFLPDVDPNVFGPLMNNWIRHGA